MNSMGLLNVSAGPFCYLKFDFVISQKEIGIAWGETEFTYDGNEKKPTANATKVESGDSITLTVSGGKTEANVNGESYTATVTAISGTGAENYKLPAAVTVEFKINKATQGAPTVTHEDETIFGQSNGKI